MELPRSPQTGSGRNRAPGICRDQKVPGSLGVAHLILDRRLHRFDTDTERERSTRDIMLEDLFSGPKLLIIVFLVVVLFGAKKIPEIAQGLGKGMREFRKATRDVAGSGEDETSSSSPTTPASVTIPCFYCGTKVARNAKFCPSCGQSLEPKKCSRCATLNELGNKFCSDCGEKL